MQWKLLCLHEKPFKKFPPAAGSSPKRSKTSFNWWFPFLEISGVKNRTREKQKKSTVWRSMTLPPPPLYPTEVWGRVLWRTALGPPVWLSFGGTPFAIRPLGGGGGGAEHHYEPSPISFLKARKRFERCSILQTWIGIWDLNSLVRKHFWEDYIHEFGCHEQTSDVSYVIGRSEL